MTTGWKQQRGNLTYGEEEAWKPSSDGGATLEQVDFITYSLSVIYVIAMPFIQCCRCIIYSFLLGYMNNLRVRENVIIAICVSLFSSFIRNKTRIK